MKTKKSAKKKPKRPTAKSKNKPTAKSKNKPKTTAKKEPRNKPKNKPKRTAKKKPKKESIDGLRQSVLAVFREVYGGDESDAEVLDLNPSGFDKDPAEFLEKLEGELDLSAKARDKLYDQSGTVGELVEMLAATGTKPPPPEGASVDDAFDGWFSNVVINAKQPTGDDFDSALNMMEFMMRKEYRAVRKYAKEALAAGSFVDAQRVADQSGLDLGKVGGIAAVMQVAIDHEEE